MPIVKIEMWEGREVKMKEELVEKVSAAVSESLSIPNEQVQVIINETPVENWGIMGVPARKYLENTEK